MYFDKLKNIYYTFNLNGKPTKIAITDITNNVRVIEKAKSLVSNYETYAIQDGDTPEIISERLYETPDYHWVIMILNEKYDYLSDFPISMPHFEEYLRKKYPGDTLYDWHHCETTINDQTVIISKPLPIYPPEPIDEPVGYPQITTSEYEQYLIAKQEYDTQKSLNDDYYAQYGVTNYEYENRLNDQSRTIKYIPKPLIEDFVSQLEDLFND